MKMKKNITLLLWSLVFSSTLLAQTSFQLTTADKKRIVTGSQLFVKSDQEIFANALLWGIERGQQLKELIEDIDYEKLRFAMKYNIVQENGTSFASLLTIQVTQGRLIYLVSDIKAQVSGLGGVLGASSFDKMNPEKKPKQKQMMDEFVALNKVQLQSMLDYVEKTSTDVSKWENIKSRQLKEGMTMKEVLLTLGKPIDVQTTSGETTQLMYNTFTYVFMKGGRVKSFIQ